MAPALGRAVSGPQRFPVRPATSAEQRRAISCSNPAETSPHLRNRRTIQPSSSGNTLRRWRGDPQC